MNQAGFYESPSFSPTSLTVIVGLHAAAIVAALTTVIEVPPILKPTTPKVFDVPLAKDKPDPPKPREQVPLERFVDQVPPVVETTPIGNPPEFTSIEVPKIPVIVDPIPLPPEPEPTRIAQSARAKGDVRALLSSDDYPESARRNEQTGTVQARLDIGANGRVTGCSIVTSSGSTALDAATCKVLKARARFTPAKGNDGQPVSDTYLTPRIVWKIEGRG